MIGALALAAAAATPCALPPGWDAVARREAAAPGTAIIFGELHGTAEAPAMVADVACALAARGQPVLVGIEFPAEQDEALQAAWRAPAAGFADRLRTIRYWRIGGGGPASQAVFDMLVRLQAQAANGAPIAVVAFNGPRTAAQNAGDLMQRQGQGPWETMQAANIDAAAHARPGAHVLVLVGDLHARRVVVTRGGYTFDPMARVLARSRPVLALDQRHGGGEAYNCGLRSGVVPTGPVTSDMIECAPHPEQANGATVGEPRVLLGAPEKDQAYDGVFFVGPITASPPVKVTP